MTLPLLEFAGPTAQGVSDLVQLGWDGKRPTCFFLDRVLRSMLPYALPQFKKGLSPTFALYSGQEICMVCFPADFAYSHKTSDSEQIHNTNTTTKLIVSF